jgi:uncharacterized membrane protein
MSYQEALLKFICDDGKLRAFAAHKIQFVEGDADGATITVKDGEQIKRITVNQPAETVWEVWRAGVEAFQGS